MFFKVSKTASLSGSEQAIIKLLVEIRYSDYKPTLINELSSESLAQIRALMIKLGERILEANCQNPLLYTEAKINFNRVVKAIPEIKFILCSYAAQLVQYFTIVSTDDFTAEQSIVGFNEFLSSNKMQFGDTDKNLFITEYKLIKIYNNLCDLVEEQNGTLAPRPKKDKEELIKVIHSELVRIRKQIDLWILDAPENIFVRYLSFCHYYCYAKALEFNFTEHQETLSEEEKLEDAATQDFALKLAQEELVHCEYLKNNSKCSGLEFSLGQDVFNKMPADLDKIKSHVASLRMG
jgi:hypothetical protein